MNALTVWKAGAVFLALTCACSSALALESGTYQTIPGATMEERGDRVTNNVRVVPISAAFTFDLEPATPSMTAVLANAVLEGGDPFQLTVRSSSALRLSNGAIRFSGDYLGDLQPSGSGYLFDWTFSTAADGTVLWNGFTGWSGGHLWVVTITDIQLAAVTVPEPENLAFAALFAGILCRRWSTLLRFVQ